MTTPDPLISLPLEPTPAADGARGWTARWPTAEWGAARWVPWLRLVATDGATPAAAQNGDEEALLLVLTGTHDLQAGGGSWKARGLRDVVFDARPSAVFLPPGVRWQASGGRGELLLAGAVQPELPEPETPEPAAKKPLLALAGSGKAFDPGSMEWKPQESFPNAPEALLPRRIATVEQDGGVRCERVMPLDYKALTLTVDEWAVPAGTAAEVGSALASDPGREEAMVFLRCEGEATVTAGGVALRVTGDGAVACKAPGDLRIEANGGRVYAAVASGGPKPQT